MNAFDATILTFVNRLSQHSAALDRSLELFCSNHLLKGGAIVTIMWWLWFKKAEDQPERREQLLATIISGIFAVFTARMLAVVLPFRPRPLHAEDIGFVIPHGVTPAALDGWSSFPSDHCVLFFALSTGIVLVSKSPGLVALFYTAFFIAFPRVYIGFHYPTDVIAGAAIGVALAFGGNRYLVDSTPLKAAVRVSRSKPGVFYSLFFLVTYQIADMFDSSRAIVSTGLKLLK